MRDRDWPLTLCSSTLYTIQFGTSCISASCAYLERYTFIILARIVSPHWPFGILTFGINYLDFVHAIVSLSELPVYLHVYVLSCIVPLP